METKKVTSVSEHRLKAIEAAATEIQNLAKQLVFNNSLRGRNINVQAQIIKDNVKELRDGGDVETTTN